MATTIRGADAVMKWSYHTAATLGTWTLTVDDTGGALIAQVRDADTFKLSQPALTFRVTRQNGPAFVWPVLSLLVDGATLTARVGPQG